MNFMFYEFYELLWLFIIYSFAGWILETAFSAIRKKQFNNRGLLNGPVCIIYGLGAVFISELLHELSNNLFFLFLGSFIIASLLEWFGGHILERLIGSKWWDYSSMRFNIDGYICIQVSFFWSVLSVLCVRYVNAFLLKLFHMLPNRLVEGVLLFILAMLIIDLLGTIAVIRHTANSEGRIHKWNSRILNLTNRIGNRITNHIRKRMEKAYKKEISRTKKREERHDPGIPFAKGCDFYKLFWLFLIGSFIGAMVEIIFCRITTERWMSRSSLVWGQFSIVWGLGIGLFTALLYKYRESSTTVLFVLGTILGGFYEYTCSVFTEYVFGTVFWDYSKYQFNLGGRINLLYCFFWGIAAVIWFKLLYPKLSALIELIPKKTGTPLTWLLLCFMIVNIVMSSLALVRYYERSESISAKNAIEKYIDEVYPDYKMKERYPNAKIQN